MPQLKAAQELLFTSTKFSVNLVNVCRRRHKNIRATLEQNPYKCFSTMTYLL